MSELSGPRLDQGTHSIRVLAERLGAYRANVLRGHLQRAETAYDWVSADLEVLIAVQGPNCYAVAVPLAAEAAPEDRSWAVATGVSNARAWGIFVPRCPHHGECADLTGAVRQAISAITMATNPTVGTRLRELPDVAGTAPQLDP